MDLIHQLDIDCWNPRASAQQQETALTALESGKVLFLPDLRFDILGNEQRFLSTTFSNGKSKNISLREDKTLRGAQGDEADREQLASMIARFAGQATQLVTALFPSYAPYLSRARTSFRPFEAQGRVTSYRKDDTRLHVDAFPSRPNQGKRLLRVFTNVNPEGRPRIWRLGEPFENLAQHYLPRISRPFPGSGWLMAALGITKGRRSEYDHIMLRLHDMVKEDMEYQKTAPYLEVALPAGSTWIVFSDQVLHAVLSGQFLLEQTLDLPLAALRDQETAPLRVLERLRGRRLAAPNVNA